MQCDFFLFLTYSKLSIARQVWQVDNLLTCRKFWYSPLVSGMGLLAMFAPNSVVGGNRSCQGFKIEDPKLASGLVVKPSLKQASSWVNGVGQINETRPKLLISAFTPSGTNCRTEIGFGKSRSSGVCILTLWTRTEPIKSRLRYWETNAYLIGPSVSPVSLSWEQHYNKRVVCMFQLKFPKFQLSLL